MAEEKPNIGNIIKALIKALLPPPQLEACSGCSRPYPGHSQADGWLIQHFDMDMRSVKCPDCQSPNEKALFAVEDAIGSKYVTDGRRLVEQPKPTEAGEDSTA